MTCGRVRLERALAVAAACEPAAAHAAAATLGTLFGWGNDRDDHGSPADSWSGSVLSRDGYPVELGFVPGVPGVRYTAELPGDADRWHRTLGAARGLGAAVPPELATTLLDPLRRIQTGAREALRYGAWLSGRHTADRTRFKLYTEVPPGSASLWRPWEGTLLDRPAPLPTRVPTLRMVGLDLTGAADPLGPVGRIELYYDLTSLHPSEVALLAERVGLADRTSEILDLLREATCLPLRHELPARCDWGFSYALEVEPASGTGAPLARPVAFTLYTFANALFGGDGKIRRAILALGRSRGWSLALYERISEPLASRRGFVTSHGVFGATVTADRARPPVATWGLAPPAVRKEDLSESIDPARPARPTRPMRLDGAPLAAAAGGRR